MTDGLQDVRVIAESAPSATCGWRTICVRERRRLGGEIIALVEGLDLDADVRAIAPIVRELSRTAPPDASVIAFGLFDAIDDETGRYAGFHVAFGDGERRYLRSDALDAIVRATDRAPRPLRPVLAHAMRFGAAALIARFATAAVRMPHVVLVAFDDSEHVAALGRTPRPEAVTLASAIPRLVQPC